MSDRRDFTEIEPYNVNENVFKLVGKEWMMVTAGSEKGFNMMTASWGGMGILWDNPVCFIFIRPTRHTFGFLEKSEHFSIGFFSDKYRKVLDLCGARSGRNIDKAKETGLTPVFGNGTVWFEESRLVFVCRKTYFNDLLPANFLPLSIDKEIYPKKDYHRMYIGEIEKCLVKEQLTVTRDSY
jgi:flavin reductase (DIM6/NTAB) family NADH-FMN oxidoreductase RutF